MTPRTSESAGASAVPSGRSRSRLVLSLVGGLVAVALLGGGAWWHVASQPDSASASPRFDGATERIVRGDLEGSVSTTGTLRYRGSRAVFSPRPGTVTALPSPGGVVGAGSQLFAIDNIGTFVLHGSVPAWRGFERGMGDGPDVAQLEQSLLELGHFTDVPDQRFTWATYQAIRQWQAALGLSRTGELPLGTVLFAEGDLRVGEVTAELGSPAGAGPLVEVTDTTQVVEVDLRLADQQHAVIGTAAAVRLPGGVETTGTIVSVGTPTETETASGTRVVIPLVIALDDPAAAAGLQEAVVSVDIPSERREDVLSVPLEALLAVSAREFGVQVVDSDGTIRTLPVETGLFAAGRVEVAGKDIEAGLEVVVPRR